MSLRRKSMVSALAAAVAFLFAFASSASAATLSVARTTSSVSTSVDVQNSHRGQYAWLGLPSQAPGVTATDVYWRDQLKWNQMEPSQGSYNFTAFEQGLQAAAAKKGRMSFRLMAMCPGCGGTLTPSYIPRQASGAPDWNSETFLRSWEAMMWTLGQRYDKDPRLGYIDIGGYGFWGEWFFPTSSGQQISDANARRMINAVIVSFPSHFTLMNYMDPYAELAVGMSSKMGLRFDCIGGPYQLQYYGAMASLYKRAPVVGEWCPDASTSAQVGLNNISAVHVSMLSSGNYPRTWSQMSSSEQWAFQQAYVKAGYRYTLPQISVPNQATTGEYFPIVSTWANSGVAPTYDNWTVELRLRDSSGTYVWGRNLEVDLRSINADSGQVSKTVWASFPSNVKGSYTYSIAVTDPRGYLAPMKLANADVDSYGGYQVGTVWIN